MIRFTTSRLSSQTVGQEPLRLRRLVPTAVLLLAIFGLTTQALQGERGLRSWIDLQSDKIERRAHLQAVTSTNQNLQMQIHRLDNESLDLDFLDERVRVVLGLTGRNETVIIND